MNNLFAAHHFNEPLTQHGEEQFRNAAIALFRRQGIDNEIYRKFLNHLGINVYAVNDILQIPFLPISFFKTHLLQTGSFVPETIFESSGTTGSINSKHGIYSLKHYLDNTLVNFREVYGDPGQYCFLALLPSYLEKGNSSLVAMAAYLMQESGHPENGFYLNNFGELVAQLSKLESESQQVILLGVTYALMDLAERYDLALKHVIVMETGGMKGRKKEVTRAELHALLKEKLGVREIHAEYGMTELQSQAYAVRDGIFRPSSTLKVLLRSPDDPFEIWHANQYPGRTGIINIIDLANIHTQAFIATDDLGRFSPGGGFEVLGRVDNCDIRGCSLLAV
ncbi:MAG: hypothetical protein RLZZ172_2797 [Bacteroidota bacterium]